MGPDEAEILIRFYFTLLPQRVQIDLTPLTVLERIPQSSLSKESSCSLLKTWIIILGKYSK